MNDNNSRGGQGMAGIHAYVWIGLVMISLLNVMAHLIAMPTLPERIPVHWGVDGSADGWGPRWVAPILGALPLVLLALFYATPRLDPKGSAYTKSGGFYQGFVIAFTIFIGTIGWFGELASWGLLAGRGMVNIIVSGGIGALLIGMGNYLPRIRQNCTLGIKTPWTLADTDNWRRTHRFGGVCFMVVGVGITALGFMSGLLPESWFLVAVIMLTAGSIAVAYGYSYLIRRKSYNG